MTVTITIENNDLACIREQELDVDVTDSYIGYPYVMELLENEFMALMFALRIPALEHDRIYPVKLYRALEQMRTQGFPSGWNKFGVMVSRLAILLDDLDGIVAKAMKREERVEWFTQH